MLAIWLSLTVAIFVATMGLYGWKHRNVPGALPFAASSLFVAIALLATTAETLSYTASTKIAWYRFQVIWQIPAATLMTCFVLDFTWPGRWLTQRNAILLALPPTVVLLLVTLYDGRLMWRWLEVASNGAVAPHVTVVGAIVVAYGVGLGLISAAALLWLFARSAQHRWPALLILAGLFAGRGLFLLEIVRAPWLAEIDRLVVAYLVAWAAYAIALFGFHILDPMPVARTATIEQMQEGMVILNTHGRIANLNPAAAHMLSISTANAHGRIPNELQPGFPDLSAWMLKIGIPAGATGVQAKVPYATEFDLENGADTRRLALDCSALEDFRGLLIGYLLMLRDVTEQYRARAEAEKQQQALAVMHERERLARELHDSLAQVLAFVNVQGQTVRRLLAHDDIAAADQMMERLVEVVCEADTDIRESIFGLRVALTEVGLWSALTTYLDLYERRYGIYAELKRPAMLDNGAFEPQVEVQLLRIIQEALANARKHARAHCVYVSFATEDGWAQVVVQDDGCGFDLRKAQDDTAGRVGLRVMRERAEEIGGALEIQSAPGHGTEVIVTAPLAQRSGASTEKEASHHACLAG